MPDFRNCVVIGAGGSIGLAIVKQLIQQKGLETLHVCSRQPLSFENDLIRKHICDYSDASFQQLAADIKSDCSPDLVLVATGILHDQNILPEKALRHVEEQKMLHLFRTNTVVPTLAMKYFLPIQPRQGRSVFAALSARVGSIGDNRLGGWYSYRASKAALNMMIRTAAIEQFRFNADSIVVGLHPGTVNSHLSKPFQGNVPKDKLFSPDFAAARLLIVLQGLDVAQSGNVYDWAGKVIEP